MPDVVDLKHSKKTYQRYVVRITYVNGNTEDVVCTFFGHSLDNADFMMFTNAHPDAKEEEIPDLMVNVNNVLSFRTLDTEEVER